MILRIILTSIAWLFLAAHYSRADSTLFMVISLLIPFLFLTRRRWSLILLQILTLAGTLVWILTILEYVQLRMMEGESWIRLALILGSVTLYTLVTAILLSSKKMRKVYK